MKFLYFFLNIIIISNLILLTKEEGECDYQDCFNCVVCGDSIDDSCKCYWNNNECSSGTPRNITYSLFSSCKDDSSKELINQYCGQTTLELNDDNIAELEIPSVNWKYGMKNLFCTYTFSATESKEIFYIINFEVTSKKFNNLQIYLSVEENDGKTFLGVFSASSMTRSVSNVKEIKLMVYFERSLKSIPFNFSIIEKRFQTNTVIVVTTLLIILFIIICFIFIYTITKKLKERRRPPFPSRPLRERTMIIINDYDEEETKKKIENMIKKNLSSQVFSESLGIRDKCSICLDDFKVRKDKVSITPCKHIFHYDCLIKWLLENYQLPKCPNCNYNIVEYFENQESPKKLTLNKNTRVNVRTYNNFVTSNENINITTNHNSNNNRNDRRNGLSNNNNITQENH
jgi:hypothetical protein